MGMPGRSVLGALGLDICGGQNTVCLPGKQPVFNPLRAQHLVYISVVLLKRYFAYLIPVYHLKIPPSG